jgi:hypothetical protein
MHIFIAVLDEMPQLHQLQHLCRGNIVVNIIREVARSWEKFALYLMMERNMIDIWKRNADDVEDAARKLFGHWLDGNGRKPISWKTLVQALRDNDLSIIATEVEEILTGHSGENELMLIFSCIQQKQSTHTILNAYSSYTQCCSTCIKFNDVVCACNCLVPMQCVHMLTVLLMGHFNMCRY